jgi:hypothetical protein
MDIQLRVDNLEHNYPRLADSLGRMAGVVEKQTLELEKHARTLFGFPDSKTNEYVPGDVQRIKKLEDLVINSRKKWKTMLSVITQIVIGVAVLYIAYHIGVK